MSYSFACEALKSCKLSCGYLKFLSKSFVFKLSPDLSKHTFRAGTILLFTSASFQNNTVLGEVQGQLHLWCTYFGVQLQMTEFCGGCNYICACHVGLNVGRIPVAVCRTVTREIGPEKRHLVSCRIEGFSLYTGLHY